MLLLLRLIGGGAGVVAGFGMRLAGGGGCILGVGFVEVVVADAGAGAGAGGLRDGFGLRWGSVVGVVVVVVVVVVESSARWVGSLRDVGMGDAG